MQSILDDGVGDGLSVGRGPGQCASQCGPERLLTVFAFLVIQIQNVKEAMVCRGATRPDTEH